MATRQWLHNYIVERLVTVSRFLGEVPVNQRISSVIQTAQTNEDFAALRPDIVVTHESLRTVHITVARTLY